MGRSQESYNKKEVRNKKEQKRKEKEKKRIERKDKDKPDSFSDMIAYVDENGVISATPPDPAQRKETKAEDIPLGPPPKEAIEDDAPKTGIVSFFNNEKGYGFIKEIATSRDYFVHMNNLKEPVKEGNKVSFEVEQGIKGLVAVNVELVK